MPVTFWFYVISLAGGAFVGAWLEHRWDSTRYAALEAQFSDYRAKAQAQASAALTAANAALQAQSALRTAAEARNAQILAQYETQRGLADSAARDRDIARRLLRAAYPRAADRTSGHPVPETADRSGADGTAAAPGYRSAAELLGTTAAAIADCRDAVERLDALQRELKPQL